MTLVHDIIEVRPHLGSWLILIEITDTDTGEIYCRRFKSSHDPTLPEQEAFATIAKTRIALEFNYEANELNNTVDEQILLTYYRDIKKDIVLRIRQFPNVTLQEAETYITDTYSNSPFDFTKLYIQWLSLTGLSNWADFKQFCIDRKFREID